MLYKKLLVYFDLINHLLKFDSVITGQPLYRICMFNGHRKYKNFKAIKYKIVEYTSGKYRVYPTLKTIVCFPRRSYKIVDILNVLN